MVCPLLVSRFFCLSLKCFSFHFFSPSVFTFMCPSVVFIYSFSQNLMIFFICGLIFLIKFERYLATIFSDILCSASFSLFTPICYLHISITLSLVHTICKLWLTFFILSSFFSLPQIRSFLWFVRLLKLLCFFSNLFKHLKIFQRDFLFSSKIFIWSSSGV